MIKIGNWIIKKSEIEGVYCDSYDYKISIYSKTKNDKYEFIFESKWSYKWNVFKLRIKLFAI